MTYKEFYEQLYSECAEASREFLELDRQMFETNGFSDMSDIPNYAKAKLKWQTATNNYWGFLSYIRGKGIDFNDEMTLS